MKNTTRKTKKTVTVTAEYRPYRVLFLVVVVSVTCLVLFATLGVSSELSQAQ